MQALSETFNVSQRWHLLPTRLMSKGCATQVSKMEPARAVAFLDADGAVSSFLCSVMTGLFFFGRLALVPFSLRSGARFLVYICRLFVECLSATDLNFFKKINPWRHAVRSLELNDTAYDSDKLSQSPRVIDGEHLASVQNYPL
jgi:hypothetical protein